MLLTFHFEQNVQWITSFHMYHKHDEQQQYAQLSMLYLLSEILNSELDIKSTIICCKTLWSNNTARKGTPHTFPSIQSTIAPVL